MFVTKNVLNDIGVEKLEGIPKHSTRKKKENLKQELALA